MLRLSLTYWEVIQHFASPFRDSESYIYPVSDSKKSKTNKSLLHFISSGILTLP